MRKPSSIPHPQATMLRALRRVARPVRRLVDKSVIARTYLDPAETLWQARRFADADDLLTRGLTAFPGDFDLMMRSAQTAHRRGLVSRAVQRWEAALDAHPDSPACSIGLSAALRARGEMDRAREVIMAATRRFDDEPAVEAESARIDETCGDVDRASQTWARLCSLPACKPEWRQRQVCCLILLHRLDEADRVLEAALAGHAQDVDDASVRGLLGMRGALAAAREDWPAAVAFWTAFRTRFPDDDAGWQRLGQMRHHLEVARTEDRSLLEAGRGPAVARAEIDVVVDDELRALMLGFESIGATCEFGLVQRRYGAEPLGLLRWNTVDLDSLLAALAAGFEGLGEPAHTELVTAANGEFIVRDRRWGFAMHTWLFEGQVDLEGVYAKVCRRIVFLKDKLLADLAIGEKVFVFLSAGTDVDALRSLHRALRGFGPIRLLAVQPAAPLQGPQGSPGDIVDVAEGLKIGFIERLGQREDAFWDIAFADWVALCRAASSAGAFGGEAQ